MVRDEREIARVAGTDHPVRTRQGSMGRYVQGRLIGADRIYLVNDDASWQLVSEIERLCRTTSLQLVHPVPDAVDRATERVPQAPRLAVVMPVGEQYVLRNAVLFEPAQAVLGDHRIDQHARVREVVRADGAVNVLVPGRPVPQARGDLLHGLRPTSETGRSHVALYHE